MSIWDSLENIRDVKKKQPTVLTIMGLQGVGKTMLGATFPNPVFIQVEAGTETLEQEWRSVDNVYRWPKIRNSGELWAQLQALAYEPFPDDVSIKTVVIDTITMLDAMFLREMIEVNTKPNLAPPNLNTVLGGYGAGRKHLESLHYTVREWCEVINQERGLHVVFLGHAEPITVDLPDTPPFTKYSLSMEKASARPYLNQVHLVGFLRLKTLVSGVVTDERSGKITQKGKGSSAGERVLVTYAHAAYDTKNRYGITQDLPVSMGENPLYDYIPSLKQA